ncbi:GntR family transcriptional regulator [Sphingobium sp. H39-3-25]|nr:GntR family transcriptional regulator [Sphingobium arseniciresistens]
MQERVYQALRADYLAGHFSAGEKLDVPELADRYRSSKTPVREAACRLMGEGLIDPHPDGGFRIAFDGPDDLIDLYAWNMHLILSLVHGVRESMLRETLDRLAGASIGTTAIDLATHTGAIFLAFAQATGNPRAIATIRNMNERLYYPRILEITDTKEAARELRTLTNSAVTDVQKNIRRRIEAYHDRRIHRQKAVRDYRHQRPT